MNISISQRTDTMSAAIVTGRARVRIETLPLPATGRGQVRIRLEGCGVCASNLVPLGGSGMDASFRRNPARSDTRAGALSRGRRGRAGFRAGRSRGGTFLPCLCHARHRRIRARSRPCRRLLQISPFRRTARLVPSTSSGARDQSGRDCGDRSVSAFLGILLTEHRKRLPARGDTISRRRLRSPRPSRPVQAESDSHGRSLAIIEEVKQLTDGRFLRLRHRGGRQQWPLDLPAN